jgi:hypothetical protein
LTPALFGGDGVKGQYLLFELAAAAVGAGDAAFLVFGLFQNFGEYLLAAVAEVFILGHVVPPAGES